MAKGVRGLWARLGTIFILTDARFVGRSDAAQALFVWFLGRFLDYHGEFLPLEYSDPRTIAKLRGRTIRQTEKAIAELAAAAPVRPLVNLVGDNRIRVAGQREKHGDQIGWRDERPEAEAWNAEHPDAPIDVQAFAEHVPVGRPRKDRETTDKHTFHDPLTTDKRRTTEQEQEQEEERPARGRRASSGGGGAAGKGQDVTTQDTENGAFDQADNPKAADVAWNALSLEFGVFNGHDAESQLAATALARGMMGTYPQRVEALAAVFVAAEETRREPDEAWATFKERLRGRGGAEKVWRRGRAWAKRFAG